MFLGRPYFYGVLFFSKLFIKYIFPEVSSFDEMKLKVVKSLEGMGSTKVVPMRALGETTVYKVLGMIFPTTCLGKESGQSSSCPSAPFSWPSLSVPFSSTSLWSRIIGPWSPLLFICTPCPFSRPPSTAHVRAFSSTYVSSVSFPGSHQGIITHPSVVGHILRSGLISDTIILRTAETACICANLDWIGQSCR